MLTDLEIFQTASAMARHAAARQKVIARNIANADTPGFKARDLESFSKAFARNGPTLHGDNKDNEFRSKRIAGAGTSSPNGNTVSLEDQMWRSAAAARQHETAITIYSKTLTLLRTALGGGR